MKFLVSLQKLITKKVFLYFVKWKFLSFIFIFRFTVQNLSLSTTVKISTCTITIVGCNFATVLETRALLHPTK